MIEDDKLRHAKGASKVIWTATIVSVLWAVLALWMFAGAAPCAEKMKLVFQCLKANERGDMLAGVFAPLALVWLVATVIIQSTELKEQRNELIEGRKVNQAQASFIGEQTSYLKDERESAKRLERDAVFNLKVSQFRSWAEKNWRYELRAAGGARIEMGFFSGTLGQGDEPWLEDICSRLERITPGAYPEEGRNITQLAAPGGQVLEELVRTLHSVETSKDELSPSKRAHVESLRIGSWLPSLFNAISDNDEYFRHIGWQDDYFSKLATNKRQRSPRPDTPVVDGGDF
jgi:hypothetical protein